MCHRDKLRTSTSLRGPICAKLAAGTARSPVTRGEGEWFRESHHSEKHSELGRMGRFLCRIASLQNFLKLKWLGKSKVKRLRGYILRGFNFSFSICWKKCQLKVYLFNSCFLFQTLVVLEQLQKLNVILYKKKNLVDCILVFRPEYSTVLLYISFIF